jgi:hypothetical protein
MEGAHAHCEEDNENGQILRCEVLTALAMKIVRF